MSVAGFTIIENHFSYKNKKVSFCDEVKEYDGCSDFNRVFSRLCDMFFNPKYKLEKIINSFDMLSFLNDIKDELHLTPRSFIEKCLEESKFTKAKLLNIKRQEKILEIANHLYKLKNFTNKMMTKEADDEYWNHEFWRIRSNKINNRDKKIALLRKGCRDFNICLGVCHLPLLEKFIEILNDTLEWY